MSGRNPGISLAIGKHGKLAAIYALPNVTKVFMSMSPKTNQSIDVADMPPIPIVMEAQVKNAKYYGMKFTPEYDDVTYAIDVNTSSNFNKGNTWQ